MSTLDRIVSVLNDLEFEVVSTTTKRVPKYDQDALVGEVDVTVLDLEDGSSIMLSEDHTITITSSDKDDKAEKCSVSITGTRCDLMPENHLELMFLAAFYSY